jgi:hypothetical protein
MPCQVCSQEADLQCSICKSVTYCSRDCQKKHWSTHKNICKRVDRVEAPKIRQDKVYVTSMKEAQRYRQSLIDQGISAGDVVVRYE